MSNFLDVALALFLAAVAGYAGGWAAVRGIVRQVNEIDRRTEPGPPA